MKNIHPPKWASRFLSWFVSEELHEEIVGDLEEAYLFRTKKHSKWRADLWYVTDVLRFFRPYSFERFSRSKQYLPMLSNYIKIAFRNIIKKKSFTAINLVGLTLSLSVVIMISLFLDHHLSYDNQYPKSERTYRLENIYRSQTYAPFRFEEYYGSDRNTQLKNIEFLKTFSEIEEVTYLLQSDAAISLQDEYFLDYNEKEFRVDLALFTNTPAAYTSIFPPAFEQGNDVSFKDDFHKALLTESLAKKIFGSNWKEQEILGKTFNMVVEGLDNDTYTIAGVVKDPEQNSHFIYKLILSTERIPSWGAYTYFTTSELKDQVQLSRKINERYDEIEPKYGVDERYKGVRIQKMTDIHTSEGDILYELRAKVNPDLLLIFATVAFLILVITWTNYMNLSIAMYSRRQKEIGLRKVLGARVKDVVYQLMLEIILIAFLALPFAILMVLIVIPAFNEIMEIELLFKDLFSLKILAGTFAVTIITGVVSSLYPAIIFSRKKLLGLLSAKLNQQNSKYGFSLRRALIGVQFILLIFMLSLTGYIYLQINYIKEKDLGFEQNGIISIPMDGSEKHQIARSILKELPGIEYVGAGSLPGVRQYNMTTYKLQQEQEIFDDANVIYADIEAMKALGIEHPGFVKLENGKEELTLVNRTMAEKLKASYNLSDIDLLDQTIVEEPEYVDPESGVEGIPRVIEGILPDMHYFSLKHEVNPLIFRINREVGWTYNSIISIEDGANPFEVIPKIEEAYYTAGNTKPFDYGFLSDDIRELYKAEQRSFWLISALSLIAIFLSIMGLIGLVSFLVYTRQKEIGIRKVFGAEIHHILLLLNKEFIVLLVAATVIATPFILLLTGSWLDNFAYRIAIDPIVIGLTGFIVMILVITVVSLQSFKAANSSPNEVLTDE